MNEETKGGPLDRAAPGPAGPLNPAPLSRPPWWEFHAPGMTDAAAEAAFDAWLAGDRSTWDDRGNPAAGPADQVDGSAHVSRETVDPQPSDSTHDAAPAHVSRETVDPQRSDSTHGDQVDPAPFRYLVLAPSGSLTVLTCDIADALGAAQAAVRGYVEPLAIKLANVIALVNEEGSRQGLPINVIGTRMMRVLGNMSWFLSGGILGNVVLMGRDGSEHVGLTDEQIRVITEIHQGIGAPPAP